MQSFLSQLEISIGLRLAAEDKRSFLSAISAREWGLAELFLELGFGGSGWQQEAVVGKALLQLAWGGQHPRRPSGSLQAQIFLTGTPVWAWFFSFVNKSA